MVLGYLAGACDPIRANCGDAGLRAALKKGALPFDNFYAQRGCAGDDLQQSVDIWVRAWTCFGICGVFRKYVQCMGCGGGVQQAEVLRDILVDGQRSLFAGLVFNARNNCASGIGQINTGD